ncbi:MAG: PD40 domain-containing protein, partial [Proteobacteria bacterium]|nr:PD40 domain-containing protein [Pseudomonadota bacterium]
ADGTHIVFESLAKNFTASSNGLNNIYHVDTSVAHNVEQISVATGGTEANGGSSNPSISEDGSSIVFQSIATNLNNLDNDGIADIYLHYRPSGRTELLTVNPINNAESGDDASSNPHISGNAEYVAFESKASNLASGSQLGTTSILVRNLNAWPGIIIEKLDTPASSQPSSTPAISTDGRYVSFHSAEKYSDDTDTLSDIFRMHNSTRP